ncbi:hypothetical protein [Clostridium tetani]|uniref:hypothetical protein n=1 Tax=Clostridium tetani TaxID=1513 RepID=UPI00100BFDFF|nr:hypothetical protein [Clostridium tetani]RXM68345.1 hypothetical protein DP139_12240 [Clostridium tetani]
MDNRKIISREIFKEIVKVLVLIIINIVTNKKIYGQKDFTDILSNILTIIGIWIIYLVLFYLCIFITRPISLQFKLINKLTNKNETELYHFEGASRQDTRTIVGELKINKKNSVWNKFALKLLKKSNIELLIEVIPDLDEFCCTSAIFSNEISKVDNSFKITIKDIITSTTENREGYCRKYEFIVNENRDNPPQINSEFIVKSKLKINDNVLRFPYNLLFEYNKDVSNIKHKVNFYK